MIVYFSKECLKKIIFYVVLLIFFECNQTMKLLLFLGDSITYGYLVSYDSSYPVVIERLLYKDGFKNYKIVNAGFPGDTTLMAYQRLEFILKQYSQFSIVVIFLGANDYLQGIPTQTTYEFYKKIIQTLQPISKSILIIEFKPFMNSSESYEWIYASLKTEYPEITIIPEFFQEIIQNPEYTLEDGLHPNKKGYEIFANKVYPYIIKELQK